MYAYRSSKPFHSWSIRDIVVQQITAFSPLQALRLCFDIQIRFSGRPVSICFLRIWSFKENKEVEKWTMETYDYNYQNEVEEGDGTGGKIH